MRPYGSLLTPVLSSQVAESELMIFPTLKIGRHTGQMFRGCFRRSPVDDGIAVAVKKVPRSTSLQDLNVLRQYSLSGVTAANLIATAECVVQDAAFSYLGFAFCDGSLAELIERDGSSPSKAPLSFPLKHSVIKQMVQGLAFLHKKDISHRNIRPTNVLYSR